jgi:hypothetical protein
MNLAICVLSTTLVCGSVAAQSIDPSPAPPAEPVIQAIPEPVHPQEDKRVFGVLPNYRTAEGALPFKPITTAQKFTIATKDSFDYPVLMTTAAWAGLSQLQGTDNNVYGQGFKGFAHRYGINYADQVMGNYFPEAIVPTLFHMDPRYFRKGDGSKTSRLGYAISRIVVAKNDNGVTTFNSSEIVGNALASLAVMTYHPHERNLKAGLYQWGVTYIGSDMVGQILKEFWPDIKHKLFHKQELSAQR